MKMNVLFIASGILAFSQYTFADLRADAHAPAGVMYDHMHQKGQWMVAYHVQQLQQKGGYYHASEPATADELGPYSMLSKEHDMYMHMLHVMYAVTDHLTVTLMPMYMSMDMSLHANAQQNQTGANDQQEDHHSDPNHAEHGVKGWGDTVISASYRVVDHAQHQLITSLGLSAPTGDAKKYGLDGHPVHYGMQLGAGVWQAIPSITYIYTQDKLKTGIQLATRQPIFDQLNDLGYYPGDQRSASAWISYLWHPQLSTSVRLQYQNIDTIQGHYRGEHNHSTPNDIQANYGGEQTFAGFGINTITPLLGGIRVGLEYLTPIQENLNGVQQGTDDLWNVALTKAF